MQVKLASAPPSTCVARRRVVYLTAAAAQLNAGFIVTWFKKSVSTPMFLHNRRAVDALPQQMQFLHNNGCRVFQPMRVLHPATFHLELNVYSVHRVDGVAVVSLTAHVDVYLIIITKYTGTNRHQWQTTERSSSTANYQGF